MAEYRAKGGRPSKVFGNSLRNIASDEPTSLSTASLNLGGIYHIDTLVRPTNRRDYSEADPQLMAQSGQALDEPPTDDLILPRTRTPNPSGWQSPAAPPRQE